VIGPESQSGEISFDPLVVRDGLQVSRSPWGVGDEIGRLNWMSPQSQATALDRVDGSVAFDLAVEYFLGMPSWTAAQDPKYDIWMSHTPSGTVVDDLSGVGSAGNRRYSYAGSSLTMYSHVGTHISGLNHVGYHGVFWNGWTEEANLGSRCWNVGGCLPPIIARGILLDIAALHSRECLPDSYAITAADVQRGFETAGVIAEEGDIVLLRTGRMSRWPDYHGVMDAPPGLGMDAARFLCEEVGVMCVGLDVGGEVLPGESETWLPVHAYLFATAGSPLMENLWLEDLARDGPREFALIAMPLKLRGSTGTPVRPLALGLRPA
jgi:kynurenine formamidase